MPLAGTDLEPPYDLTVSTAHTRFDINGRVYPGSRDRAGNPVINTLATCKSQEIARKFPVFGGGYAGLQLHPIMHPSGCDAQSPPSVVHLPWSKKKC